MFTKHHPLCIKCHCLEVHSADHARGIKTCRACTPIEQRSPSLKATCPAKSHCRPETGPNGEVGCSTKCQGSSMRFVNGYPVGGKSPAYIRSTISEQDKVRHLEQRSPKYELDQNGNKCRVWEQYKDGMG